MPVRNFGNQFRVTQNENCISEEDRVFARMPTWTHLIMEVESSEPMLVEPGRTPPISGILTKQKVSGGDLWSPRGERLLLPLFLTSPRIGFDHPTALRSPATQTLPRASTV
jgi:hypothetical protein